MRVGPGKVDGRAQALVGPGLATPLIISKHENSRKLCTQWQIVDIDKKQKWPEKQLIIIELCRKAYPSLLDEHQV